MDDLYQTLTENKEEQCVVEISSIIVILESGIGYYTQPLISIETNLNALIHNWNSNLSINGSLLLKMDYYNAVLAAWEPVIETIERFTNDGDSFLEPWYLHFALWIDNVPTHNESNNTHRVSRIRVHSMDNLLVTISKTFIELMTKMSISFQEAMRPGGLMKPAVIAPYLLENDTGFELLIDLTLGLFTLHESHTSGKCSGNINDTIQIILKDEKAPMTSDNIVSCKIFLGGRAYFQLKDGEDAKGFNEDDYNLYTKVSEKE